VKYVNVNSNGVTKDEVTRRYILAWERRPFATIPDSMGGWLAGDMLGVALHVLTRWRKKVEKNRSTYSGKASDR